MNISGKKKTVNTNLRSKAEFKSASYTQGAWAEPETVTGLERKACTGGLWLSF